MLPANITRSFSICYCMYFIMLWLVHLNHSHQLVDQKGKPVALPGQLLGLHIAGILWLGVVPLTWASPILPVIIGPQGTGANFRLLFFAILFIAIAIGSREGRRYEAAPGDTAALCKSFFPRYLAARIPFLISYELFFRGHLLFFNALRLGLVPSILVDVILTTLLHIFSGKKVMRGCLPFSVINCLLNIQAHAVWPSILLHLALSLSFEIKVLNKFFKPTNSLS